MKDIFILVLSALFIGYMSGCSTEFERPEDTTEDSISIDVPPDVQSTCKPPSDPDGDNISSGDEGMEDIDNDTIPNYEDEDSDGDTLPDKLEAGDYDCETKPFDSDGDTIPDFLDTDSDDNGIDDYLEGATDTDGDGTPDYADGDNDGDGMSDKYEIGADPTSPLDTDNDGIPNFMDLDSDNDTIDDVIERESDVDGDTIPSYMDEDSDGDGYSDAVEFNQCDPDSERAVNTDGEGGPDFLDTDSDGDGLSDAQERVSATSPCRKDSDGDGFDDLAEWAHPTADPNDPSSVIPEDDFYLILPPGGPLEERYLQFGTNIQVADVFFLVDTTGSMYEEIDEIKSKLRTIIIPEIRRRIPDAWFGVGWFADFATGGYGSDTDKPFALIQEMTGDEAVAQRAVDSLPDQFGSDWPESQVEAMYQTATGEGLPPWVTPYICPDGYGAPCFRNGALPIILLFTDAPMHNGPTGTSAEPYTGILPEPHTWEDAIDALNTIHAKVIGLDSEGTYGRDAYHDLEQTAQATGSVDREGIPLVFDIGQDGEYLDTRVVDSIEILATKVPIDVDTYRVDAPDNYDEPGWEEVDATCFIKRIIPQPGWIPPEGYSAEEAVAYYDSSTFYQVLPGTRVTFLVQFQNYIEGDTYCYEGDSQARVFRATIVVRGDGVTDLDEREVIIIVPAKEIIFG